MPSRVRRSIKLAPPVIAASDERPDLSRGRVQRDQNALQASRRLGLPQSRESPLKLLKLPCGYRLRGPLQHGIAARVGPEPTGLGVGRRAHLPDLGEDVIEEVRAERHGWWRW